MAIKLAGTSPTLTAGQIPQAVDEALLLNWDASAVECLQLACEEKTLKPNTGHTLAMRRWVHPAVNTTPEPEGNNPTSRAIVPQDYQMTISRYAEVYETSTYAQETEPWDIVFGIQQIMQDLIRRTRERVRWNAIKAGTNVLYSTSAATSTGTVNGAITAGRLLKAVRILNGGKAMMMTPSIKASDGVGTSAVESAFYAFSSTQLQADLRAMSGFKTVANYPTGKGIHPLEFGAWQNIRFFTHPELVGTPDAGAAVGATGLQSTTGTNIDVYPLVIVGKGAITSLKFGRRGNEKIVNVLDEPDKSDPDNARCLVSAAWMDACLVTNQDWVVRIEVGITHNPS